MFKDLTKWAEKLEADVPINVAGGVVEVTVQKIIGNKLFTFSRSRSTENLKGFKEEFGSAFLKAVGVKKD